MQPVSTYCFPAASKRPASAQSPYSPGRKAISRNRPSSAAPASQPSRPRTPQLWQHLTETQVASQPSRPRTPQLWQHLTETQVPVSRAASPGATMPKGGSTQPAMLHGSSPTDSLQGDETADNTSARARAISSKPARPQSAWRASKRPVSSQAIRQEGTVSSKSSRQEGSPLKQAEQQVPSTSTALPATSNVSGIAEQEGRAPAASPLSRAAGLNATNASPNSADNAAVQPVAAATASPDLAAVETDAVAGK